MDDIKRLKQIVVKLTEMCRKNERELEQQNLMIQELTTYYTQLNLLTLELAKSTSMSLNALAKRIIDLEIKAGLDTKEYIDSLDPIIPKDES